MTIQKLGWILAAGMAGAIAAGGFQGKSDKVGVVDMEDVFQSSPFTHDKQEELKAMGDSRSQLLQFVHTYRTITPEQAQRLKTVMLKPNQSAGDKSEAEKIKTDVLAQDKALKTLQQKKNPTPEEVTQLQTMSTRTQETAAMEDNWVREFNSDMNDQQGKVREQLLVKVKDSVQEVGKKQGYSLILNKVVAPYSANDVTAETLKVMNAKK
ncbi:MAG: hypothetical protein QOJ65_88 [Fimbriimonadaceae bacterium]|jgi:Skp family chaperone for outer membrane proteins|nr:hypothetical protein [Fimbriimonadaceae bacterium]